MIPDTLIKETVIELLRKASTKLPADVEEALKKAFDAEEKDVARMQLSAIIENIRLAEQMSTPMCQDTGVPIFYVDMGKVKTETIEKAIRDGVTEATKVVPLRPNAVHPISRKNPGDNVGRDMPYVNFSMSDHDYLEISVLPKGAGSENMSALKMLTPSEGLKGIKSFILDTIVKAGGKPCPPIIVGIGIGGSSDIAAKLAKRALLRPITERHADKEIAQLETELLEALNMTGIGPMGLGGKTTALGVNVEYAYCHTASLPVAVNIQCWAGRRATARIYENGRVEFVTHRS